MASSKDVCTCRERLGWGVDANCAESPDFFIESKISYRLGIAFIKLVRYSSTSYFSCQLLEDSSLFISGVRLRMAGMWPVLLKFVVGPRLVKLAVFFSGNLAGVLLSGDKKCLSISFPAARFSASVLLCTIAMISVKVRVSRKYLRWSALC